MSQRPDTFRLSWVNHDGRIFVDLLSLEAGLRDYADWLVGHDYRAEADAVRHVADRLIHMYAPVEAGTGFEPMACDHRYLLRDVCTRCGEVKP